MKLYEWEFKLFEKDGVCQVNMKLSTTIKSKDYMKLQEGITQLVQQYEVKDETNKWRLLNSLEKHGRQ